MADTPISTAPWAPSNTAKGGMTPEGLYDCSGAHVAIWEYPNSDPPRQTCALLIKLTSTADPADTFDQAWSLGDPDNIKPSQDGDSVQFVGRRDKINDNTNAAMLVESLVSRGYPENRLTGKASQDFNGLRVYLVQREVKRKIRGQEEQTNVVLVVDKIERLPWEAPAGDRATISTAAAGAFLDGSSETARVDLMGLIGDLTEKAPVTVAQVRQRLYSQFKEHPGRQVMTELLNDAEFLDSLASEIGVSREGNKLAQTTA